ncbi:5-deoxy-glucuronate isomerase [Photobacterium rosenbergii]|nr:5-deoxy-glucuronate isomerase [Photobacterium rosenbergii]
MGPVQGFCMQRVYATTVRWTRAWRFTTKSSYKSPWGNLPVANIAGYGSYYLKVMAGPTRKWLFTLEGDHQWINEEQYARKHQ